ncbi:MAG: hypothetical protein QG635_1329 [Bacteroidota bacterium]|nr:hypothetical protein [Bacteroidota bacterium]
MRRTIKKIISKLLITSLFFGFLILTEGVSQENNRIPSKLSLKDCIEMALSRNYKRRVAQSDIDIAASQYEQAWSGHYPQLELNANMIRFDDDLNFGQPGFEYTPEIPGLTLPAIQVPAQKFKVMDKLNFQSSLDLVIPLYLGGKVSALIRQANSGIDAARHEARKTDNEIIYDTKRIYYGAVLGEQMTKICNDALARLEATLEMTENLYQNGSGKVMKTDYLKNKIIVETTRSLASSMEYEAKTAKAALLHTIGINRDEEIELTDKDIPFIPWDSEFKTMLSGLLTQSPDLAKLNAGLKAAEALVDVASSEYYPKIGVMGSVSRIENSYNEGLVTPENKTLMFIGLGLRLPIFSGFLTQNQVSEAKARQEKLSNQKVLFERGLTMQLEQAYNQLQGAKERVKSSGEALKTANENRVLTERAYQDDILEVKDLIESQIYESIMEALYNKALYDHYDLQVQIDFIIGAYSEEWQKK